jgi:membrane-associated protein
VTLAAAIPAPGALIPWLDPHGIITSAGPWALLVVCLIIFAETALLIGFILPGDTLLVITGVLTFTGTMVPPYTGIQIPIWIVCLSISVAAFVGGEVGYFIGHKAGPKVFERKESGLFSIENVKRTNAFFHRFGGLSVILARFVPIVRTVTPVMAGVGHMNYKKYTLYNAIGAVLWGTGLTFVGFIMGYIPWLSEFVIEYIDVILIGAVLITVVPTAVHFFVGRAKAKRAGDHVPTDDEVEALAVDLDDEPGAPWDREAGPTA